MTEKEVLCLEHNLRNTVHTIREIQIIGGIHIPASPRSPHSPSIPLLPGQSHDQALGDMAVLHISVSAWFTEHSGWYKIWVYSHLKQKYFLHYTFSLASFSGWRHKKRWTFFFDTWKCELLAAFPKILSPAQVSGLYPISLCSFSQQLASWHKNFPDKSGPLSSPATAHHYLSFPHITCFSFYSKCTRRPLCLHAAVSFDKLNISAGSVY